ncbi:MAG: cytochrome b [Burkholderiales bacterium]
MSERYGPVAVALHWLSALLVLAGFALGVWMTGLALSPATLRWYGWHKWIGITVFLLAALRLAWRWHAPPPTWPPALPAWQRRGALLAHRALYALMLAVPLSGWLYSSATGVSVVYLSLVPLPNLVPKDKALAGAMLAVHQSLNATLALLVLVHVAAAAKHQWIDRDEILSRMRPWRASR